MQSEQASDTSEDPNISSYAEPGSVSHHSQAQAGVPFTCSWTPSPPSSGDHQAQSILASLSLMAYYIPGQGLASAGEDLNPARNYYQHSQSDLPEITQPISY